MKPQRIAFHDTKLVKFLFSGILPFASTINISIFLLKLYVINKLTKYNIY